MPGRDSALMGNQSQAGHGGLGGLFQPEWICDSMEWNQSGRKVALKKQAGVFI